jgi:hypothetical protein
MRRRAPLRSFGRGTFSTSISPCRFPCQEASAWRCRSRGRPPPSGETNGERSLGRGGEHARRARQRGGWVPFATHGSVATTIALVFGPIRISKLLRHFCVLPLCVISLAHSKVHNGHKAGAAGRNTCWREAPFELQQDVCISACPPLAVVKRISSSADDSDADVLLGRKPSLRVEQIYDRSPSDLPCSRSRSACPVCVGTGRPPTG